MRSREADAVTESTTPRPRLVLVCGLPGAGKTTLARHLATTMPAIRLCPDEWLADLDLDLFDGDARDRLESRFWRHTEDLLGLGQSVILEFGFWDRPERDDMRLRARALGAAVELRYLDVPVEELFRRVDIRNRSGARDTVTLTREMLETWAAEFDAPDPAELALFDLPLSPSPSPSTSPSPSPRNSAARSSP
jgi:predicted kinase